jgi:hypothetical protein
MGKPPLNFVIDCYNLKSEICTHLLTFFPFNYYKYVNIVFQSEMAAVHKLAYGDPSNWNGSSIREPSETEPQISETWLGVVHVLW